MAHVLIGWCWTEGAGEHADMDVEPSPEAVVAKVGDVPLDEIRRIRIRLRDATPERLERYREAGFTIEETFDA